MNEYIELGFTQDQINEIEEGKAAGLDVSVYARREFLAIQMRQIRQGMMESLDVSVYARAEYDWFQMEEIRRGLQEGLDIRVYAFPEVTYDRMRQLRRGLKKGIDLSEYKKLSAGILRQLRKAIESKVNIIPYIKQGYSDEQLEEIRIALEKGLDIAPYLQLEFRGASIREICAGLESEVDVSCYAKIEFGWQQMREIRLGLENRTDIAPFARALYSWQQMREIRLGLEYGLDISSYCSLMYTAADMRKKRLALQDNLVEISPDAGAETEEYDNFVISRSFDDMQADIYVLDASKPITKADIMTALRRSGIVMGIKEEEIDRLVRGAHSDTSVVVAEGRRAVDGKEGWYEYFFRTELDRRPKELPDGSVDYQSIEWFECVKEGQKVAFYHEAGTGTDGYTVMGGIIKSKRGKEKSMLTGTGFHVLPDKKTYVAAIDGRIELEEPHLSITKLLILDEVTTATGNIIFDGSVYVKGNVGGGSFIRATDDVVVDGYVESATIETSGNIVLHQGVNGNGLGYVKAGKSILGNFFENAKGYAAENIQANYCLNSELTAEGQIIMTGKWGSIAGGRACALKGFGVYNVGNRAGLGTMLKLGPDEHWEEQLNELEGRISEVSKEMNILGNAYMDFQRKYPAEVRNTMELYLKLENAIFTKEKEMEGLMKSKAGMEELISKANEARAVVRGIIFEGTVIEINGRSWAAREVRNVTIRNTDNRIAIYAN